MNDKEYYQKVTKLDPEKMEKRRQNALKYYYQKIQPNKKVKPIKLKSDVSLPKVRKKRVVDNREKVYFLKDIKCVLSFD